jgi:hypothetical protein
MKETVMKFATAVVMMAAGLTAPTIAEAATNLFATEPAAQQACPSDEVVWVDLDRGRFYHKTQAAFGKSGNGGYACMKMAHAQYREGHE